MKTTYRPPHTLLALSDAELTALAEAGEISFEAKAAAIFKRHTLHLGDPDVQRHFQAKEQAQETTKE